VSVTDPIHSDLSALDRAPVWLNSEPPTARGLRGRVVLVDIWTYSCVNWLRTLPYVRAWAERYTAACHRMTHEARPRTPSSPHRRDQ